jgi:hypothetical protein
LGPTLVSLSVIIKTLQSQSSEAYPSLIRLPVASSYYQPSTDTLMMATGHDHNMPTRATPCEGGL